MQRRGLLVVGKRSPVSAAMLARAWLILALASLEALGAEEEKSIKGFKSYIEFTEAERSEHERGIAKVASKAGHCIQRHLDEQNAFWDQWKLSRYYGYESDWNRKWTKEQKEAQFRRMHVPLEEMKKLKPISCVNMTLDCLAEGFKAARQDTLWAKVKAFVAANDQDGTSLQLALQRLGWRVLYWNPDTSKVKEWDLEERERDKKFREPDEPANQARFWGYHEDRLRKVRAQMMYYYSPVDDAVSLVDYGANLPRKFTRVPFFVGTVHTGFHVFPGKLGFVVEAHNRSRPTMRRTIEGGYFDPFHPREPHPNGGEYGTYRSGIIAVPPGYGY
jgi:hypothetical protein